MKTFEAIVLVPRMMPYRTTLLPDYKIDWNLDEKELSLPENTIKDIKIFKLN